MNESYSAWKEKRGRKTEIVVKMASKSAWLSETERFIELWDEEGSLWNILSDNYKIRKEKEKSVERILEKLEMTSKK